MNINMKSLFDAVDEMKLSDLNELNTYINKRQLTCYQVIYDKASTQAKNFLAEYGEKGFGLCAYDEYGNRFTLAPIQLKDKAYELAFFHRNDDDRCEDYNIEKEDRE